MREFPTRRFRRREIGTGRKPARRRSGSARSSPQGKYRFRRKSIDRFLRPRRAFLPRLPGCLILPRSGRLSPKLPAFLPPQPASPPRPQYPERSERRPFRDKLDGRGRRIGCRQRAPRVREPLETGRGRGSDWRASRGRRRPFPVLPPAAAAGGEAAERMRPCACSGNGSSRGSSTRRRRCERGRRGRWSFGSGSGTAGSRRRSAWPAAAGRGSSMKRRGRGWSGLRPFLRFPGGSRSR